MMRKTGELSIPLTGLLTRIPKQSYLWFAILIFGASSAVTRKLTEIGAENSVAGHNPISLCNVLFVGNLCALMVLVALHKHQWNRKALQKITRKEWLALTIVAILSGALAPGLIFQALALTGVNNVILIGRLELPLTLALSIWLLRERVNRLEALGAIVAFVGVALTIGLQTPSAGMIQSSHWSIGVGELFAAIGAIVLAVSTIIGKKRLAHVPLGIYSVFRTSLGTAVFFVVALKLYGSDHFMDAFSPFLWQWMLVYGVVIVVIGQSFWIAGLRASTVTMASLAASFTPIVGILAAYLILGEAPTIAQYLGGSVILVGILFSQIGIHQQKSAQVDASGMMSVQTEQQIESEMGFKGI